MGWIAFCPDGEMLPQRLADLRQNAKQWYRVTRDQQSSDYWTSKRLSEFFQSLTRITEQVEAQLEITKAYEAAFSLQNLSVLAEWPQYVLIFQVRGPPMARSFVWKKEDGSAAAIDIPLPAEPLDTSRFIKFTRVLRMQEQN